ncbi:hypothetical protein [Streptomyces sp. NPDC094049]|uniref:DNA polymerase III subunit beta family protein n=1 Tax=Streptomyces sp. NPDC094049 TaxID=3154987 RepID=UPI003316925D
MSVTLNAHQLGRLIDRTAGHIADESLPRLHGIRLETDATYLYAVATDRYTLAVARYRHHGPADGPVAARTIPARALPALRQWLTSLPGHAPVNLAFTDGKARLTAPRGEMSMTTDDQDFIDWRGLLRDILQQTQDHEGEGAGERACPVLDTRNTGRFAAADTRLRIWTGPGRTATLLAGIDFLGAQMPMRARETGFDTGLADDLGHLHTLWNDTLTGTPGTTAPGPLPRPRPTGGAARTVAGTTKDLLRQTMRSTRDLTEEASDNPAAVNSHATAGVMAWSAYRYLEALHRADPLLAAKVIAETADELDDGALGEYAYDAAEAAGHDPRAWDDEPTAPATV